MNRSARLHSSSPCLDQDDTFAYIAGYTKVGLLMASPGKSGNNSNKRVQAIPSWKLKENRRAERLSRLDSDRIYHLFGPITSHQPAPHYQAQS
jgi:hypothetical protein